MEMSGDGVRPDLGSLELKIKGSSNFLKKFRLNTSLEKISCSALPALGMLQLLPIKVFCSLGVSMSMDSLARETSRQDTLQKSFNMLLQGTKCNLLSKLSALNMQLL